MGEDGIWGMSGEEIQFEKLVIRIPYQATWIKKKSWETY